MIHDARPCENGHCASDVVGAAGLGTCAAVMFDRYDCRHANNVFDSVFLPASVVPTRDGVAIA